MFSVNKIYKTSERGTTVIRIAKTGTAEVAGLKVAINELYYIELSDATGIEEGQSLPDFELKHFDQTSSEYMKDDGSTGHATWLSPRG